ncbi:Small GTP-binding protein domain [Trinorchestia longiramus]|nr:Small GTP-binding protein domain [Trinorchestia longiramus]
MGKKKGSKAGVSEVDVTSLNSDEELDAAVPLPTKSKASKKSKKKQQDDDDDIAKELEALTLEMADPGAAKNIVNGAVNADKPKARSQTPSESEDEKPAAGKAKKSKFGGFAALAGDDMMVDLSDDERQSYDEGDTDEPHASQAKKQVTKKKEKKKKAAEEDYDSDNLESLPPEISKAAKKKYVKKEPPKKEPAKKEKKKGKKGKQEEDLEDDFDKILAEARAAAGVTAPIIEAPVKEEKIDTKTKKTKRKKNKGEEDADFESKDLEGKNVPVEEEEVPKESDDKPAVDADHESGTSSPAAQLGEDEEVKPKKGKKKKEEEDDKKKKKNAPNKKLLAAMKELQQKQKEEEEARRREEEELKKQEEERIREEEERQRLEEERKERKKQKEKERKERLKAEGKLLSAKQKADQRRAQEMIEHLKAQGIVVGATEKKAPRLGSKSYAKKKSKQEDKPCPAGDDEATAVADAAVATPLSAVAEQNGEDRAAPKEEPEDDGIKESWDISSGDEDDADEQDEDQDEETEESSASAKLAGSKQEDDDENHTEDEGSQSDEESEEEKTDKMSQREKVIARLLKRRETNEKNRDLNFLRAPVICVLGHVDHGKTKILDKLRRTNVQEGEVGGITQQIGATNVPAEAIANQTKMVKSFVVEDLKFPGLLIIDTPGHESFSNLRNRGSSLCDMAILVVDITQGLEPQTIESIGLLKKRKTPFIVALNKVDRVFEWESNQHKDMKEVIQAQAEFAKNDFERRVKEITIKLNEQGLNAALFYENPDPRSYVSLVPTSAITGDGMGNLIALICTMCQNKLANQLRYSEELQCVVLEVKTVQGYGTTIDVILVNGRLREGDNIVLAGTEGPIVTQIRSLLMPKPLKEIRVKGSYDEFKEIKAAQGVKIAAKELDKAIAGLSMRVAHSEDEISVLKEAVHKDFTQAMKAIKVKDKGVYVQASTLGALEALLEFFKTKSIPYSGIRVGPVVKRDVMKAAAMLEHDDKYAVILAFDVKVDRDAQELADREGVQIFSEETIYHLGDRYVEFLEEHKRRKQEEHRSVAIFPCKLKVLPTAIFNKRDPIVLGVTVEHGVLRTGTLLCVPSKEFVEIGIVSSMEFDHKSVDIAKKGVDVCIKIDPSPGTTPKMFGRHFEVQDEIVSKISRESINACKEFFRDDLSKTDWKLMAELKKLFNIL